MKWRRINDVPQVGKKSIADASAAATRIGKVRIEAKRFFSGVLAAGIFAAAFGASAQDINTTKATNYNSGEEMARRVVKSKNKLNERVDSLINDAERELNTMGLATEENLYLLSNLGKCLKIMNKESPSPKDEKFIERLMNKEEILKNTQGEDAYNYVTKEKLREYIKCTVEAESCKEEYSVVGVMVEVLSKYEKMGGKQVFEDGTLNDSKYGFLRAVLAQAVPVEEYERGAEAKPADLSSVPTKELEGPPSTTTNYPSFIEDMALTKLISAYKENPNDWALQKMVYRINYLGDEKSKLEHAEADAEIAELNKWIASLGIETKGANDVRKALYGIGMVRNGMAMLHNMYNTVAPEDKTLTKYLTAVSKNKNLFAVYTKYLSALDATSANLFEGIKTSDSAYIDKVQNRIDSRLGLEEVKRAQAQWFTDYFPMVSPQMEGMEMSQLEAQMYDKIATMSPIAALAFFNYLEAVYSSGLDSMEEKRLVVSTVSKLNAASPTLIPRYFQAIQNIAEICEGDADVFRDAMTVISTRIDMETDPLTSRLSPASLFPEGMNVRRVVTRLDTALQEIAKIDKSALSQYERLELTNDMLRIHQPPPHSIEQKPPGYSLGLLTPLDRGRRFIPPYFMPRRIPFPATGTPYTAGGLRTSPMSYGGGVTMSQFRQFSVPTWASAVGQAFENYVEPQHPLVPINEYLPGVNISSLSPTRLIMEINKAFIPTDMPEYGGKIIGGGGFAGLAGKKPEDEWDVGFATAGALITPTGGVMWGGGMEEDQRAFGGIGALAVPIGKLPIASGGVSDEEKVAGIDSALAGYEQSLAADDESKELLVNTVATHWNQKPGQSSQSLAVVNMLENVEGKQVMTARYYYIQKDGTIFEIKGGKNDFVDALNYVAGFGNQAFDTPTTYAWNVEPTIDRGGGAIAFDIENTAWLGHVQAVPFLKEKGADQPLLLQWTPAEATTVKKLDATGKVKSTDIHVIALPGKMLTIQREGEGGETFEDKYVLQDVNYTMRRVKEKSAWELDIGAGLGESSTGETSEREAEETLFGKGGFFIKTQSRESKFDRGGGGLFYEAGSSNMEAMAMMSEAEGVQEYIHSLHRVGATLYGAKPSEKHDGLVMGGLIHVVEQLQETSEEEGQAGEIEHNQVFWRTVGLIKSLESGSGARLDVSRISGLDRMMADYEELRREAGNNPLQAGELTSDFYEKYEKSIKNVWNYYNLGIQVNNDWSLDIVLITVEEKEEWWEQDLNMVQGRTLVDWESGFWRAFASVPIWGPYGTQSGNATGIVGTGVGQELFNGFWFQRAAVDAGVLLVKTVVSETVEAEGEKWVWKEPGAFVEGAVRVFSNILEDANDYRRLMTEYNEYVSQIRRGNFSGIPPEIRNQICDALDTDIIPEKLVEEIRAGENRVIMESVQMAAVEDELWSEWFYDRKSTIQKKFDGNVRMYLGASGYFYSDKTRWDVAAFVEHVSGFKIYAAVTQTKGEMMTVEGTPVQGEELGAYTGAELEIKDWRLGIMGNITDAIDLGAAMSLEYKFGPEEYGYFRVGMYGFVHSETIPQYTAPMYEPVIRTAIPEFGAGLYFQIGEGSYMPYPMSVTTPTGETPIGP